MDSNNARHTQWTHELCACLTSTRCKCSFLFLTHFTLVIQVEIHGKGNWTALMIAARGGRTDCVRLLLDCGAKVDTKTAFNSTALMFACEKAHVECVELLLAKGADVPKACVHSCA